MQYAICKSDNEVWEASRFAQLETSALESKRRNLACTECGEFAWFRKESRHGHPAHFCAHHDPDCELKINYASTDDLANEGTGLEDEVSSGKTIIVRLDQETGGDVEVTTKQHPPREGREEGGKRFVLRGRERQSNQQFTLRRILHRLVKSYEFRESDTQVVFYKNNDEIMLSGPVKDIVTSFDEITREKHHDKTNFYWGPIASVGKTADGKIWLNSTEDYNSASVVVFDDIANIFLQLFNIDDLDDLLGAWVLVAGNCWFSGGGSGKPIIWCGTPNYIFVRKYRDPNLQ
ncbi:hypothetical protein [Zobellella iuensis]|uniref:Uncharacterized protein n=1 Tax=Zobellella iuensis TaxID=2803811 RepID=A0ABS1QU42_9GAMM|nr:hypothetical protein [Zobellella iuensis]MBL1377643.1 hypothetical protein [Zobellella iuensis]